MSSKEEDLREVRWTVFNLGSLFRNANPFPSCSKDIICFFFFKGLSCFKGGLLLQKGRRGKRSVPCSSQSSNKRISERPQAVTHVRGCK